jgi:hypothetical protein
MLVEHFFKKVTSQEGKRIESIQLFPAPYRPLSLQLQSLIVKQTISHSLILNLKDGISYLTCRSECYFQDD